MKLLQLLVLFVVIACGKDDLYVMQPGGDADENMTDPEVSSPPSEEKQIPTEQDIIDSIIMEYEKNNPPISEGLDCSFHNSKMKCQGYLIITKSKEYQLELSGNNKAKLFINNELIINNTRNHENHIEFLELDSGVHHIKIDSVLSSDSSEGTTLFVDGEELSIDYLYH